MENVLRVEINAFSLVVIGILFLSSVSRAEHSFPSHRLFMGMLLTTGLMLVLDTVGWLNEGSPTDAGRTALAVSIVAYYILQPVPATYFALFVIRLVNHDQGTNRARTAWFHVPLVINMVLAVSSLFFPGYFYFDADNYYHRGSLFPVFLVLSYVAFFFAYAVAIRNRKRISRRVFWAIIVFPLLPLVGGVIQSFVYGNVLVWPAATLSLLIVFMNIQARRMSTDALTDTYTRQTLDEYVKNRIARLRSGHGFSGILVNIDGFRRINDSFGHSVADAALVTTADLLRASFTSWVAVYRYSGDEFVVLTDIEDGSELEAVAARIRDRFLRYEEESDKPYCLGVSIGAGVFDPALDATADRFFTRLGDLMYEEKLGKGEG